MNYGTRDTLLSENLNFKYKKVHLPHASLYSLSLHSYSHFIDFVKPHTSWAPSISRKPKLWPWSAILVAQWSSKQTTPSQPQEEMKSLHRFSTQVFVKVVSSLQSILHNVFVIQKDLTKSQTCTPEQAPRPVPAETQSRTSSYPMSVVTRVSDESYRLVRTLNTGMESKLAGSSEFDSRVESAGGASSVWLELNNIVCRVQITCIMKMAVSRNILLLMRTI